MSDTDTPDDKLIARVRKLLTLARHPGTPKAEAEAAMGRVQDILATYNMSMATLEAETKTGTVGGKREKTVHDAAAMYEFQRSLMATVATVNFCRCWVVEVDAFSNGKNRRVKRHQLLGRDVNVMVSFQLYDYLIETMDRELPYTGMEKRGKDALKWLDGCASRLIVRLTEKKKQMQEESARAAKHPGAAPVGTGLVLSDVYSSEEDYNEDAINGWEPGTTARNRKVEQARHAAWLAESQKRYEERAAKRAALVAQGYPEEVASKISWGYTESEAYEKVAREAAEEKALKEKQARALAKPETDKQRAERERRERARESAYYASQAKRAAKYWDPAYQAGRATGDKINLDDQIEHTRRASLA